MQYLKMLINSSPCPFRGSLAIAHHLKITDTYARSGGKMATSGAAALVIENMFDAKDRFIEPAKTVELHTDFKFANNFIKMWAVEQGFITLAQGQHELTQGEDHIIVKGLI